MYEEPYTATAGFHIKNLESIITEYIAEEDPAIVLENANIINEYKETIEFLKSQPSGLLFTLYWNEGLEGFSVKEGM